MTGKFRYCYIIQTPVQCCLTLVRATRSYYQHIHGSRESKRSRRSSTSGLERLKCNQRSARFHPILVDVLDAATELTPNQRARAAHLLAKHVKTFPAPGTPITGRTDAVMHDIDTGSTRPIRCNPRKLSPEKDKDTAAGLGG